MNKVHLIQHTHWDREWYFTDMDAQILADGLFTDAIEELERESKANFVLDGQTSIVDEYVASHPNMLSRIKRLVQEGRLYVGPWYTQTDAVNVDAESILMNAIIGQLDAKQKYGNPMKIAYLPDTFGFGANLPALLNHVALKKFIFWRGMNYRKMIRSPYFRWVSPNGSEVTAVNLPPNGYSAAFMTDSVKNNVHSYVKKILDPTVQFVFNIRGDKESLIPVGMDQMYMIHSFTELVSKINKVSPNDYIQSSFPELFDSLKNVKLPVYQGELRDPVYARVHRTIGSVRTDLKLSNSRVVHKILVRLEPLMVIAMHNQIHVSSTMLTQIWKLVLECQAHDSMGGSVTDNVAIDIAHRFKQANELIDGIENLVKYKLAEQLNLNDHQILMFNTSLQTFNGIKTFELCSSSPNVQFPQMQNVELLKREEIEERKNIQERTSNGINYITEPKYYKLTYRAKVSLPALGYQVFSFKDSLIDASLVHMKDKAMVGSKIKIFLLDGKIHIETNEGSQYTICFLDSGNDGDTYDYSPLDNDFERELLFQNMNIYESKFSKTAIFNGHTNVPYNLNARINHTDDVRELKYHLQLTMNYEEGVVTGKIVVNNNIKSHRMRLLIKTNKEVKTISQTQGAFSHSSANEISGDWKENFVEKPVNIFVFDKSVSITNVKDGNTLSLISNDLHEFETMQKGLCITLFASTGQLGKPNLSWRPGRASGDTSSRGHVMMPTPQAQTIGDLSFEFSLFFSKKFNYAEVVSTESSVLSANVSYQRQRYNLFANRLDNKIWPQDSPRVLPEKQSVFDLPKDYTVSSVYPSLTQPNYYIIRLVNLTDEVQKIPSQLKNFTQVNGLEEPEQNPKNEITPFSIISFEIKDSRSEEQNSDSFV